MEALEFKIQLKPEDKTRPRTAKFAFVFVTAYDKTFKDHRFMWSTGFEVKRSGFDPQRPGKAVSNLKAIAENASASLRKDGLP